MALTLTVGTNTYVSRADASTYFESRLSSDAWDDADDGDKDKALAQATRNVEALRFKGRKKTTTQTLSFPRCYYRDDRHAFTPSETRFAEPVYPRMICEDAVPQTVIDAVCEEALALLDAANDTTATARAKAQAQGVTSWKADDVSETYARAAPGRLNSSTARALLTPYVVGAVSVR